MPDLQFLERLETLIRQRIEDTPDGSYTASLAARGMTKVAQKVGEEGVELALAVAAQDDQGVVEESADLIYHVLVALAVRGIRFADVIATLERRHALTSTK